MPAHPDMSEDVAAEITRYILSLAAPGEALPAEGSVALDRHESAESGAYVLTATYVDRGANGVAPLERQEQLVLRSPTIRAVDVTDRWGMGAPHDSAGANGGAAPLRVQEDGAYLHLGPVDLTGVGRLVLLLSEVTSDLTLELRAGGPRGERIAAGTLGAVATADLLEAPLALTSGGEHDLYLVVRSADDLIGPWSPAALIHSLRFERGSP